MKTFLVSFVILFSFNSFAGNLYDKQLTNCQNGAYKLTIQGKHSLFGNRNILVQKDNQTILDENYEELFFPYSDRNGSSIMGNVQFSNILNYARKIKPKSIVQDMDYTFRASTNANIFQTYSSLQPKFGGDTQSIILELVAYKTFVVFELESQCKITR